MKKLSSSEARSMFLNYFESKGHLIMPSASLIPDNDPSILWINAGVAPLKKYFDGRCIPPKRRLTNAQKCIRTNDIENVGKTARHHTFFEMLGNFSIGDYFRDEALSYAWELLTSDKYFDIDKDKLYITVYPDDMDSINKWLSLGVDSTHIIKCKDNFWDIGVGPCGPDSEIFYDRGKEYDKDNLGIKLLKEDIENDRYIEIWNIVFSQYNHVDGLDRKDFKELPHKNIDTGMGLERLVCILNDCKTNYDTDLFMPIICEIEKMTNVKYNGQLEFKAISDHIKTITFALADNANFSNEGRGYVLRRILRRASRFGKNLGINKPFMYELVSKVVEIMNNSYPYLSDNIDLIKEKIKKEEETFLKTLSSGEKKLNELILSGKKITGSDVFKLYDTYGFPYELTSEILEEKNIKIDKEEFDLCMKKQKDMARSAIKDTSGMNVLGDVSNFNEESKFTGYDSLEEKAKVIFVGDINGNCIDIYNEGIIICDKTPFYATMGGQKGDIGYIINDNLKAEVTSSIKAPNGQIMHYVRILPGSVKKGDTVILKVDKEYRHNVCQNHSATHLLQCALRKVLGNEVHQAGSYVDDKTLRFDFNYSGKITDDEVIKVENEVNNMIKAGYSNETIITTKDEALKMGAMALFNEKYSDNVRVVKFGDSIELCGGTHIDNTLNIGSFAIKEIESKGLNVYRIEAVCDSNLEIEIFSMIKPYNDEMKMLLSKSKKILKQAEKDDLNLTFNPVISNERPKCYKDILENKNEVQNLRKDVALLEKNYKEELTNKLFKNIDGYIKKKEKGLYGDVIILSFDDYDFNSLKSLTGSILSKLSNGIVFIINTKIDSINFVLKVSDDLKDKIDAGSIIKEISIISGGNGGGSKTFAQGGGSNIDKKDEIISYIRNKTING